jgi:hypothetical protein
MNPYPSRSANRAQASSSRFRRFAFNAWAAILVAVYGVGFFGLTSLVLAWFEDVEGVAGPVTDLGYGVLVGIIQTTGWSCSSVAPSGRSQGSSRPSS